MNIPNRWKLAAAALLTIAVILLVVWSVRAVRQTHVDLEVDDRINITPEKIESIKAIGEWEFLSVTDEQLVDTIRHGLFSDDELARIYYGTLRLGINMHQVEPGWIKTQGDSVAVTLPPIILLDRDFIDEARTRTFHERGRWQAADREALYLRAHQKMLAHGMTPQNIESARKNGEAQFRQLMRSMGYEHVAIQWNK